MKLMNKVIFAGVLLALASQPVMADRRDVEALVGMGAVVAILAGVGTGVYKFLQVEPVPLDQRVARYQREALEQLEKRVAAGHNYVKRGFFGTVSDPAKHWARWFMAHSQVQGHRAQLALEEALDHPNGIPLGVVGHVPQDERNRRYYNEVVADMDDAADGNGSRWSSETHPWVQWFMAESHEQRYVDAFRRRAAAVDRNERIGSGIFAAMCAFFALVVVVDSCGRP